MFATRTFRRCIWVNGELDGLEQFVGSRRRAGASAGGWRSSRFTARRSAVKHTMRRLARHPGDAVSRRPTIPGDTEIAANPRARSAKLRVVEQVA